MGEQRVTHPLENGLRSLLQARGITFDTPIFAAVSGGRDSSVLAYLLGSAGYRRVTLLHLDHWIRDRTESACDRRVVRRISERFGFRTVTGSLASSTFRRDETGIEQRARDERYAFFARQLEVDGGEVLLTAHHLRDSVETVLMRILSGRGGWGSSAIPSERNLILGDGGLAVVLRPLSDVPVDQLVSYAREKRIPWREDVTNSDLRFTRNRIRSVVLPALRSVNPNAEYALARLSRDLEEIRAGYAEMANELIWSEDGNGWRADAREFFSLPFGVRLAALQGRVQDLCPDYGSVSARILKDIARVEAPERRAAEFGSLTVTVDCDSVVVAVRLVRPVRSGYVFRVESYVHLGLDRDTGECVVLDDRTPQTMVCLTGLSGALFVRNASRLDRIWIAGADRKIVPMLGNTGVGRDYRHIVPLLEDANGVCAVYGSVCGGVDYFADRCAVDTNGTAVCGFSLL